MFAEMNSGNDERTNKQTALRVCDSCRKENIPCCGTLPCTECSKRQASEDSIECTYNYEVKQKLNTTVRKNNKQIYMYLKERIESLEQTLLKLDDEKIKKVLYVAKNSKHSGENVACNAGQRSISTSGATPCSVMSSIDSKRVEKIKVKQLGIKVNRDVSEEYLSRNDVQKEQEEHKIELGKIFLLEEGQIEQRKASFKLFFYLVPLNLKSLFEKKFIAQGINEHKAQEILKKVIPTAERIEKLNTLLQKDNELYVKRVFQYDDSDNNDHMLPKLPQHIIAHTISNMEYRNKYCFMFYQANVLELMKKFEFINSSTEDDGYISLKTNFTDPEASLIVSHLLNNCKFYKESASSLEAYNELTSWENTLLQYVISFNKTFTSRSKIESSIEDNFYNIQALLQLSFYLENSPSPRIATNIVSTCISYLQILHYDDCAYLNRLFSDSDVARKDMKSSVVNSLKFQIRASYLECYMYDKTLSLRCHKPELLNNKDEAFSMMNQQVRDLIFFYGFDKFLTKEQLDDSNEEINILDKNSLLFQNLIKTASGSYIIIQELKLRVAHLHSIAYKYLIAVKNENHSIDVVMEKKKLILDRLQQFKNQAKGLFLVDMHKKTKDVIVCIDSILKDDEELVRKSIKWQYISVGLEYCTLYVIVHLSDFEILQHIETQEEREAAIAYCKNPNLLAAMPNCLETAVLAMQFDEWHKYESGSILFCIFTSISAAFNIALFNSEFFKANIDLFIQVIKLVTKHAFKRGFIDPLKWSAVSVLGISYAKILFALYGDTVENELKLSFDAIFKEDFFKSISALTRLSNEIINSSVNRENSSVNRENNSVNRENSSVNRENSSVHRENSSVNRENSSVNRENSSVHRENSSVNRENSSVHKENSSVHKENSSVHRENKSVHKENNFVNRENNAAGNNDAQQQSVDLRPPSANPLSGFNSAVTPISHLMKSVQEDSSNNNDSAMKFSVGVSPFNSFTEAVTRAKEADTLDSNIEQIFNHEILQLLDGPNFFSKASLDNSPVGNDVFALGNSQGKTGAAPAKEGFHHQTYSASGGIFAKSNYGFDDFFEDDLFETGVFRR